MSARLDWIPAAWPAPPDIIAGCTTRSGGTSFDTYASLNIGAHVGDIAANVRKNRGRFIVECGLPSEPAWLMQMHGEQVAIDPPKKNVTRADGILCRAPGSVCAVMVADCLPVLFVSASGQEIAAAHAGWRGLSGGILEATAGAFQSSPDKILAWLGPAISQRHFEVGDEVRQAFMEVDTAATKCFVGNDRGCWQADLYGLARQRLAAAGVRQIYGGDLCTFGDSKRFFSHRRDGQCGRMAAFVALNPA